MFPVEHQYQKYLPNFKSKPEKQFVCSIFIAAPYHVKKSIKDPINNITSANVNIPKKYDNKAFK